MVIDNIISTLYESPGKGKHPLLKYGPPLMTALLVIWIASKLVNLTWLLLDKPVYSTHIDETNVTRPTTVTAKIEYDEAVDRIASTNLFGEYVEPPAGEQAPIQTTEIDIVDLRNLTLKGTVASTTDNNGLAIIEKDGEEHVFTVRETVAPGYELERVFADRVHLLHGGVLKKLMLPKLGKEDAPASGRSSNTRRTTSRQPSVARNAAPSQARSVVTNSAPAKLGDLLRPQPVFQNGKQLGYRVYPGRKRDQFKALGLKAGDLVTEINGTPLDDPSRGLEIFRSMNDSTQVSVTVERNGAQTSLVLDTSQLNIAGDQ